MLTLILCRFLDAFTGLLLDEEGDLFSRVNSINEIEF